MDSNLRHKFGFRLGTYLTDAEQVYTLKFTVRFVNDLSFSFYAPTVCLPALVVNKREEFNLSEYRGPFCYFCEFEQFSL